MKKYKILFIIAGSLISLLAILYIVSLFLPSTYKIETTVVVKAQSEDIFPFIDNLKSWQEWTVWNKAQDSSLVNTYDGPSNGEGAILNWKGKKLGEGYLKITLSRPVKELEYEMGLFKGSFKIHGKFSFVINVEGTKVTWTNNGDVGSNPIARYFLAFSDLDKVIAPDYKKGLTNLKTLVEERLKIKEDAIKEKMGKDY